LLKIRHEKQVILENRIFREQQYTEFRQREYEEALEREHALYTHAKDEYRQQVGMQMEQHLEIINQKKRVAHERNIEVVKSALDGIIELVFKVNII
jgi:hypothetical protein